MEGVMISTKQVEQYNNEGFLVVNEVFTSDEIDELLDAMKCEKIQNHMNNHSSGFDFHLIELTTVHPTFLRYASHPKLINIIKPLLGEDIHLHHSKLTVKMPGKNKSKVLWHQDFPYFPHSNTSLLAVMICLVDFSLENGCMKMVKGSSKLGILNHRDEAGYETNCLDAWAWEDNAKVVAVTPKKGGISIHNCLCLHSSDDNVSSEPRSSLVYQYRSRDAYQLADKVWEDTGLVVAGKSDGPCEIRLEAMNIPLIQNRNRYPGLPFGSAYQQTGKSIKDGKLTTWTKE